MLETGLSESANVTVLPWWSFWCHHMESVLVKKAVPWCQVCESLRTTRDRLSTKNTLNDVLWVPATCSHRPAVMTSCSTDAKININNTLASPRTCSRQYIQLRCVSFSNERDIVCSVLLAFDWSEFIPEKEPSLPALSRAGCQIEQMEERSVSVHSNG